jgi:hypothetical protein
MKRIQHRGRLRLPGDVFQLADRRMQDLVDDAARQSFQRQFLLGSDRPQAAAHPVDFCLADCFQMFPERNDRGYDVERLQAGAEALDLSGNNGLGPLGFAVAVSKWLEATDCRSSMS